jgi:predicted outer membrane repeat protein
VAVTNSLVIGNKADNGGQGGGIYSTGALTLTNALVSLNTATATVTPGGGLYWTGTLISPTTGVIFNKPDNVN